MGEGVKAGSLKHWNRNTFNRTKNKPSSTNAADHMK